MDDRQIHLYETEIYSRPCPLPTKIFNRVIIVQQPHQTSQHRVSHRSAPFSVLAHLPVSFVSCCLFWVRITHFHPTNPLFSANRQHVRTGQSRYSIHCSLHIHSAEHTADLPNPDQIQQQDGFLQVHYDVFLAVGILLLAVESSRPTREFLETNLVIPRSLSDVFRFDVLTKGTDKEIKNNKVRLNTQVCICHQIL